MHHKDKVAYTLRIDLHKHIQFGIYNRSNILHQALSKCEEKKGELSL